MNYGVFTAFKLAYLMHRFDCNLNYQFLINSCRYQLNKQLIQLQANNPTKFLLKFG